MPRLLVALSLCVALVACGSDEERTVTPDDGAVAAAAQKTSARGSARVVMKGTIEASGQSGTYTGDGVVRFKPPGGQLGFDMVIAGQALHLDAVTEDATFYMKFPPDAGPNLPDGKTWVKIDLDEALGADLSGAMSAGSDPGQYLRLLAGSGGARKVGTDQVSGRSTTHYTATIDYRELAESGPEALRDVARQSLRFSASPTTPVDVWIDEQGLVRKEALRIETKAVGTGSGQKQEVEIEFPEYDVDTGGITTPPESDTFDATDAARQRIEDAG